MKNKFKEIKVDTRSIRDRADEIDRLLSQLIKEQSRIHKLPIETKSINPFFI